MSANTPTWTLSSLTIYSTPAKSYLLWWHRFPVDLSSFFFFFLISKKCLTKRRRKVISNNLRNPPCSCPLNSSQGRKNERKKTLINPARSIKPSSHCADRLMPTNRQDTIEGAHVQRKVQQEKVLSTSSYCNFLNRRRWSMIPCTKEAKEES